MKIVLFSLFFIILGYTQSKKKAKKQIPEFDPLIYKPEHFTYEYWCDICKSTLKEITKRTYGKKSESDIIQVLEDLCDREIYKSDSNANITIGDINGFATIRPYCVYYVFHFREELELLFTNRKNDTEIQRQFCWDITKVVLLIT
jgi:hypothetical protein